MDQTQQETIERLEKFYEDLKSYAAWAERREVPSGGVRNWVDELNIEAGAIKPIVVQLVGVRTLERSGQRWDPWLRALVREFRQSDSFLVRESVHAVIQNVGEAIGILRMLDCGSNTAFETLNEVVEDTPTSVDMLYDIVVLGAPEPMSALHVEATVAQRHGLTRAELWQLCGPSRASPRVLEPRPGARMLVAGRASCRRSVAQDTRASGGRYLARFSTSAA